MESLIGDIRDKGRILEVTRAGSNTVFEGMILGKPMLLLSLSQRVSRGDQVLNARYVERQGMGREILDEELTARP